MVKLQKVFKLFNTKTQKYHGSKQGHIFKRTSDLVQCLKYSGLDELPHLRVECYTLCPTEEKNATSFQLNRIYK